ncbi:MAG: ABC transporter permease [Lachnospiraceae bacterium]|nr:ABC transporter permease [Lachnospiraceae bacterium]
MFFRILRKDLKRKKTMNIIILLFVILATMFVASSVNNILTVISGLDYYFDKAGLTQNYFILSRTGDGGSALEEVLTSQPSVKDYRTEPQIIVNSDNFTLDGTKPFNFTNAGLILSLEEAQLNYFDEDNNVITEINPGEIYITGNIIEKSKLNNGDTIVLEHSGTTLSLTIAGSGKDAFFGSDFMGNPRFIIHPDDYEQLMENETIQQYFSTNIYYISTDDIISLKDAVSEESGIMFDGDISMIRMTYFMPMIIAGILLVVSIGLILVSFTVLRFTIGFTIAEEFREIGVMKAIGMGTRAIRCLYITKYLGIGVLGAVIGFVASVPFGNMLLVRVSKNMVLGSKNSLLVSFLCSAGVVAIILLFCYSCTKKIKTLSPIDAVRNGQTGERFGKKSLMHLGKSRLGTTGFLALNDLFSSPKQFGIITAVFSICLLLVMILANTANTLCSDKLIPLFGVTYSDVYMVDTDRAVYMMNLSEGDEIVYETLKEVEDILAENGMPAECVIEVQYKYSVSFNGHSVKLSFQQGKGPHADEYVYQEGSAPSNEYEIALTPQAAELIGAHIGDTVYININGEEKEYMVTAFFSTMNQMGEFGRLHEDAKTNMHEASGAMAIQVEFTDHPDSSEITERIEKMKELFDNENIFTASEYVNDCTGASDSVRTVEYLVLMLTLIITALVTVLMERSFITKEKSEIALMRAIGIDSKKIMGQHTLRFCFVVILAAVIADIFSLPLTRLCMDPIFHLIGTAYGIEYQINPIETFAVYPLALLGITTLSAFLTSLYTRTITASQTSNIE